MEFLSSIKAKSLHINPLILMSDDDPTYFKVASSIFSKDITHYLCKWHIHKNWRINLRSIADEEIRADICNFLCPMFEAPSIKEF